MKKRVIAWLTTVVMLLTSVPGSAIQAIAEEVPEEIVAQSQEAPSVSDTVEEYVSVPATEELTDPSSAEIQRIAVEKGSDEAGSTDSEMEFVEDAVANEILQQDAIEEELDDISVEEDLSDEVQEEDLLFASEDDEELSPLTAIELEDREISLLDLQVYKEFYDVGFLSGITVYEDNVSYPISVGDYAYSEDDYGNLSYIYGKDGADAFIMFTFLTLDGEETVLRYDQPGKYKVRASHGNIFDEAYLTVTDLPDIMELTEDEAEDIHIRKYSPVYVALDCSMSEDIDLTITGSGMNKEELIIKLWKLVDGFYESVDYRGEFFEDGESYSCHYSVDEGETYLFSLFLPREAENDDEFNGTIALGSEYDEYYVTVTWHKNINGSDAIYKEKYDRYGYFYRITSYWNDDSDVGNMLPDGFSVGSPDGEVVTSILELMEDVDLYLHWTDGAVTVNWDLQGGIWSDEVGTPYTGIITEKHLPKDYIASNRFYYSPYYADGSKGFMGWSLTPEGDPCEDGTQFEDIQDGNDTITLYAVFRGYITVTLNGGEEAMQIVDYDDDDRPIYEIDPIYQRTYLAGYKFQLDGDEFYRDGYVITGWKEEGDQGQTYSVDEEMSFKEPVTLNAVWSKAYQVKFYPGGGEITYGKNSDGVMAWGEDPLVSQVALGQTIETYYAEKSGYVFNGWEDTSGEFVLEPGEDFTLTVERDVSFYPIWEESCTITLKTNGGYWYLDDEEPCVEDQVCYYAEGEKIYLDDLDIPEHETKVFAGWATKENPTSEDIVLPVDDDETSIPATDGLCLYAVWSERCTVIYDPNGGYWWEDGERTDPKIRMAPLGSELYYGNVERPEKEGKIFAGWAATENPTEDDIVLARYSDDSITLTGDITLYAVWMDGITIHWDPQGGYWDYDEEDGEMPDTSIRTEIYLSGYEISSNEIDNVYWQDDTKVFAGWSLTPDGEIWLPDDSSKVVTDDLDGTTLYAIYGTPITITLNGGEGSFSEAEWYEDTPVYNGPSVIERTIAAGNIFRLYPDMFRKEGYTLTGWELDGDPDQKYSNYREYTFDRSVTLNAVWKEAAEVTWDPNGGCWTYGLVSSLYSPRTDQTALGETIWAQEALKEGYALLGWSTEREGGDIFVKSDRSFIVSQKQMTLYAQWMEGYQVTFNGNGGHTDSSDSETEVYKMVPKGGLIDSYSNFVRDGMAFVGWAADDPNGEPIDLWTYTINKDTVFYAVWAEGYQVTYNLCGGMRSYDSALRFTKMLQKGAILYPDAESYNLIHPDGKAFVGWSTVENDKTHLLPGYSDEMMTLTGPIELYAIWDEGVLVTFNANGGYYNNNPSDISYSVTVPAGSSISSIRIADHPDSSMMLLGYSTSKDRKDLVFNIISGNLDYLFTQPVTLYSIWVPYHKVVYDGNGKNIGYGAGTDKIEYDWPDGEGYYGYQDLIIPEDLKPFCKGWSTTPDGKNRFDFTGKTVTSDMTFYAIWNVSYSVSYEFVSSSGEELPREVLALCPVDENEYEDGETVTLAGPEKNRKVETDEGYWIFDGYDKSNSFVIDGEDVTVIGTWTYTKETPSIEYVFVSADETALPQAVLDLCPDPATADKGSTVTPVRPVPESVEDGDFLWTFLSYSPASAKIGSAGVVFTGTWQRSEKDKQVFYISYEFTASAEDIAEAGELPEAVMILLPQRTPVYEGAKPECAAVTAKSVPVNAETIEGNWVFEGFDITGLPEEMSEDITVTGTWKFESKAAAADFAADVITGIVNGETGSGIADDLIDILDKADSSDILEQLTQNIVAEVGENPDALNEKLAEATAKLDEQLTDVTNDPSKKITVSNGSENVGAFVGASEPAEDAGTGIKVEIDGAAPTVASVIRNQDTTTLMENDSENYHYQAEVSVTKVKEQGTELTLDISLDIKIAETGKVVQENVEPTTPVTITMTLPENFIGQELKLLHTINETTGETEEVQYSLINEGKQILFTLSSLSPFELQILNCRHPKALTHVDGKEATCTAAGYKEYYECSICKAKFSDEEGKTGIDEPERIPSSGHNPVRVSRKDATCKEAGHIEYWECGSCGKTFSDQSGLSELSDQDILIPSTGVHTWNGGIVTQAATEDTTGIMTYTCTVCGESRTEIIPKIPVNITIKKKPAKFKAKAEKKGKVTLTWNKLAKRGKTKTLFKQVSKIEIQYSTDSTFASGVTKKMLGKKKAKQVLKLNPNMTYYVRIRYTDGKGGVSAWVTKKVKTRK